MLHSTRIRCIEDRILIRLDEADDTFEGSRIIKPGITKANEQARTGRIVKVGPGRQDPDGGHFVPMELRVGQHVLFGRHAGVDVEADGKKFKLLREADVFAELNEGGLTNDELVAAAWRVLSYGENEDAIQLANAFLDWQPSVKPKEHAA